MIGRANIAKLANLLTENINRNFGILTKYCEIYNLKFQVMDANFFFFLVSQT